MLQMLVAMEILFIGLLPGYRFKRCLVIEVLNMWEVSTGGSHNTKNWLIP
jgi:hypothetical protein